MLSSSTRPGLRRAPLQSAAGPIFDAAPRRNIAKSPLRKGAAGQSASGVRSRDNCAAAPSQRSARKTCAGVGISTSDCRSDALLSRAAHGRSTACRPAEQSRDRMPDADSPHASPRPRVAGLRFRRIRPSGRGRADAGERETGDVPREPRHRRRRSRSLRRTILSAIGFVTTACGSAPGRSQRRATRGLVLDTPLVKL